MNITAYIDGACSGNPGPGGWGVCWIETDQKGNVVSEEEIYGPSTDTTNQKMELTAAIKALEKLITKGEKEITIKADSQYVVKGITEWILNWRQNGWVNSNNKPIGNMDLFKELDSLASQVNANWVWVKGHAGEPGNEKADKLAVKGRDEAKQMLE